MSRRTVIAVIGVLLALAWFFRWEPIPTSNSAEAGTYVLDRWTGNIDWVFSYKRMRVKEHETPK